MLAQSLTNCLALFILYCSQNNGEPSTSVCHGSLNRSLKNYCWSHELKNLNGLLPFSTRSNSINIVAWSLELPNKRVGWTCGSLATQRWFMKNISSSVFMWCKPNPLHYVNGLPIKSNSNSPSVARLCSDASTWSEAMILSLSVGHWISLKSPTVT